MHGRMNLEIRETLLTLPKADLHVHFEGTVSGPVLRELASRNGIDLNRGTIVPGYPEIPPPKPELLNAPFLGTFFDFIQYYIKTTSSIRSEEDFALIAENYGLSARTENIRAVEMYFTPTTFLALGCSESTIAQGLKRATEILSQKYGIKTGWIFDIVRNGIASGEQTVEIAERFREIGIPVVAIGLAGLEAGYPVAPFASALLAAKKQGFLVYVHSGETAGPESVWETIQLASPDRIGHGVRAIEDEGLLKELRTRRIPLEVCPWSNIALNLYTTRNHPLNELLAADMDIILASDDPGIFGKSLTDNYLLAYESGVSIEQLKKLAERSLTLGRLN